MTLLDLLSVATAKGREAAPDAGPKDPMRPTLARRLAEGEAADPARPAPDSAEASFAAVVAAVPQDKPAPLGEGNALRAGEAAPQRLLASGRAAETATTNAETRGEPALGRFGDARLAQTGAGESLRPHSGAAADAPETALPPRSVPQTARPTTDPATALPNPQAADAAPDGVTTSSAIAKPPLDAPKPGPTPSDGSGAAPNVAKSEPLLAPRSAPTPPTPPAQAPQAAAAQPQDPEVGAPALSTREAEPAPARTPEPAAQQPQAAAPRTEGFAAVAVAPQRLPTDKLSPDKPLLRLDGASEGADLVLREDLRLSLAEARASALPQIRQNAVLPQIADQMILRLSNQTGAATGDVEIRLDPPELGRVRIGFSGLDGALTGTITAERPEIEALLRRHADALERTLADAGFSGVTLNFGRTPHGGGEGGFSAAEAAFQPEGDPAVVLAEVPGGTLAGASGLDIRL
ncbi:MAG: flagellar hook-length control protein FliK [Pseudomonadota bacterium]